MSEKIRPHHLDRNVRQSSAHLVLHNRESSALQYAMRDRLIAVAWSFRSDEGCPNPQRPNLRFYIQLPCAVIVLDKIPRLRSISDKSMIPGGLAYTSQNWHRSGDALGIYSLCETVGDPVH